MVGVLIVGLVVFVVGLAVWWQREVQRDADRAARVACGYRNAAAADAPDKTEAFVRFTLSEGALHAAKAEKLSRRYEGFGDGMAGLAARAGGRLDTQDVLAVNEVCGPV